MGGVILIVNSFLRVNGVIIGHGVESCYHFSTVLLSILIFLFFNNLTIPSSHIFAKWGLKYSMHIYVIHWLFTEIWYMYREDVPYVMSFTVPFVIFFASMLISYFYQSLKARIKNMRIKVSSKHSI